MKIVQQLKSLKSILFFTSLCTTLLIISCKSELATSSDLTYPIVDTNQGFSYDNYNQIDGPKEGEDFYGQDAQYTGVKPSYTDTGNGVITDNVTGLVWTQNLSTMAMPWSEASSYCDTLTTGGYNDWRLPTVKELWSIRDFSQGWPWLDTDYFHLVGDGSEQRQHHSWTSNRYLVKSDYQNQQLEGEPSFIVNDWTGHIKAMSGNRFVRAVRGNKNYGINNFVDNNDETITDKATGLMWSKNDNGEAINWEAALAYAENATVTGYEDWRLPNIKELQSIADYSGVFPAMDTTMFNLTALKDVKGQTDYPFYWSSTNNPYIDALHHDANATDTIEPGYSYAWMLAAGYCADMEGNDLHGAGAVVFDTKSEEVSDGSGIEVFYHHVRLVRGGNVTKTPAGDATTVKNNRVVSFPDGITNVGGRPGQGEHPRQGDGPEQRDGTEQGRGPNFTHGAAYLKTIGITVTSEKLATIIAGPPAPSASKVVTNFAKNDIVITEAQAQALLNTLNLR